MNEVHVNLAALRADYEQRVSPVDEIAEKHRISLRTLYNHVRQHGWRQRAPRRMDRNDLVNRALRLLEDQILKLEFTMNDPETDESVVLGKLSATLDRLISVKADVSPAKPRRPKTSRLAQELRQKVADRIARLNES